MLGGVNLAAANHVVLTQNQMSAELTDESGEALLTEDSLPLETES